MKPPAWDSEPMTEIAAQARKYIGGPLSFVPVDGELHIFRAHGPAREYYACARTPEELWHKVMAAFEADAYAREQQLQAEAVRASDPVLDLDLDNFEL